MDKGTTVKITTDPAPPDVAPDWTERATSVAISALPGDLPRVERALTASVRMSDGFLAEAGARLAADGNRLRPTLTLERGLRNRQCCGSRRGRCRRLRVGPSRIELP